MNELKNHRPRVVITGMGVISPLGSNLEMYWDGLLNGQSGIRRITLFDAHNLPCQIAGEIPDFDAEAYIDRKEARRLPRVVQVTVGAGVQAMQDAGLTAQSYDPERTGVVFGSTMGGIDRFVDAAIIARNQGYSKLNPFWTVTNLPNTPAFMLAQKFQALGPNITISTACATSNHAIGEAAEHIRRGAADVVITGGSDATVLDFMLAGFCAIRALPTHYNDDPAHACRPFDARREGFIVSEGCAILILERLEHALARGAHIYAELVGYGSSSDAYHLSALEPEGLGPMRAMRWALQDAGLTPDHVDYINAHGTGTPLNDLTETKAVKTLFCEHAYELKISSTKSMIGHAVGAAGALEAAATVMSVAHDRIPPTINYEYPDPECDLDYTPNQACTQPVEVAISNSFGLGGQNACLVLQKYHP